eukprot:353695-Chlamydomonas_euryale.AAC.9
MMATFLKAHLVGERNLDVFARLSCVTGASSMRAEVSSPLELQRRSESIISASVSSAMHISARLPTSVPTRTCDAAPVGSPATGGAFPSQC